MRALKLKIQCVIGVLFNKKFYLVTYDNDNEVRHRVNYNINEEVALYSIQNYACSHCGEVISTEDYSKNLVMNKDTDHMIHWNCEDQAQVQTK